VSVRIAGKTARGRHEAYERDHEETEMPSKKGYKATDREKARICELHAEGRCPSEIALSIDRSRFFVRYWMDKMGLDTSAYASRWKAIESRAVDMKRDGETTEGIARALDVGTTTIRGMLARHGLTGATPPAPIEIEEAKRLLRLYESGAYTIRGLCRQTRRGRRAVKTALERARQANRPGPKPKPRARAGAISNRERSRIRSAYLDGASVQDLVRTFGRSENTIYKVIKALKPTHTIEPSRMVRLWRRGHSIAGIARYEKISLRTVRRKLAEAGIGSTQPLTDGLALVDAGVSVEAAAERVICDPARLRGAVKRAARARQAAEVQSLRAHGMSCAAIAARLGPTWNRKDVEKLLMDARENGQTPPRDLAA
jgi:transposase